MEKILLTTSMWEMDLHRAYADIDRVERRIPDDIDWEFFEIMKRKIEKSLLKIQMQKEIDKHGN